MKITDYINNIFESHIIKFNNLDNIKMFKQQIAGK